MMQALATKEAAKAACRPFLKAGPANQRRRGLQGGGGAKKQDRDSNMEAERRHKNSGGQNHYANKSKWERGWVA